MTFFWLILAIVYSVSLLARYTGRPAASGPVTLKPNKALAFVVLTILILISGLRSNIGDTEAYMHSYNFICNLDQAMATKDFGFAILVALLHNISSDPQILIFVTAFITNVQIFRTIYTYAIPFELGIFLYLTTGYYIVSMNGIRQFLASAIIFSAIKWLIDGNWKKYFLLVLFASTLHLSALIMIPVFFIVRQKAWSRTTNLIMVLTIITFVFFKPFTSILFAAMGTNQYAGYRDFIATSGLGANVIRIIVTAVPVVLAFLGRRKLRNFWPKSDYIVNLSLVNFIFMVFAGYNWIFARFCIYFGLYNLLLLPWIIKYVFTRESQRIMYLLLVVCYSAYYYYETAISLKIIYKSSYLNF